MAMGVAAADSAIAPMNEQLGALVAGDLPSGGDRFLLGLMDRGRPLAALRLHRPPGRVGHNMLVPLAHWATCLTSVA
jgi:hypothetical protein